MAVTGTYSPINFGPFAAEYVCWMPIPTDFDIKIICEVILAFNSLFLQKSKMAALLTYRWQPFWIFNPQPISHLTFLVIDHTHTHPIQLKLTF